MRLARRVAPRGWVRERRGGGVGSTCGTCKGPQWVSSGAGGRFPPMNKVKGTSSAKAFRSGLHALNGQSACAAPWAKGCSPAKPGAHSVLAATAILLWTGAAPAVDV